MRFDTRRKYRESEVNDILNAWHLFGDHCTLRRELINMRLVAFGPTEQVFTPELLQKTYGGRLTILSDVADAVAVAEQGRAAPKVAKGKADPRDVAGGV